MAETELLIKRLAEARAEIAELRLRLSNSSLLLKYEMTVSGKLPKFEQQRVFGTAPRIEIAPPCARIR